jgi:leader peptidase (prepilin peptidase)/N-methyltransferase
MVYPDRMIGTSTLAAAALCLLALLVVDFRSHHLPDALNLLFGLLGLVFHALHDFSLLPLTSLLAGASLSALLLYGLRFLWLRRRGIEALGLGGVEFVVAAGLWVGIDGIFLGIALGALLALAGIALVALWRARRLGRISLSWPDGQARIPFGPGLILAGVAVFLLQVFLPGTLWVAYCHPGAAMHARERA